MANDPRSSAALIQRSDRSSRRTSASVNWTCVAPTRTPPRLTGIQTILISYLENEVEGVTFKLTDPKYLDDIEDTVERVMTVRHKERKFGRGCVEEWRQQAPELRAQAEKLLLPFEQMLRFSPFLLNDAPVYADYLLFGVIGNLTYRGYNEIPAALSSLKDWNQRIRDYRFE